MSKKKSDADLPDFLSWSVGRLSGHRRRLNFRLNKKIDDESGIARLSQIIDLLDKMIEIALGGALLPTKEKDILLSEATSPNAWTLSGSIAIPEPELVKEIEEIPLVPRSKRQYKSRCLGSFTPYQILGMKIIFGLDNELQVRSLVELGRRLNPKCFKTSNLSELGKRILNAIISKLEIILEDDFDLESLEGDSRHVIIALFKKYPRDFEWLKKTALGVMGKAGRPKNVNQ